MSASLRQCQKEKELNRIRLLGWSLEYSPANNYLTARFPKFNKNILEDLAKVVSIQLQIPLDREAQRNKTICIKWFDEHFSLIKPFLESCLCVLDEKFQPFGVQTPESLEIINMYHNQRFQY